MFLTICLDYSPRTQSIEHVQLTVNVEILFAKPIERERERVREWEREREREREREWEREREFNCLNFDSTKSFFKTAA